MKLRPVIHFTSETGYEQPVPFHPEESYPELADLLGETSARTPIYAGGRALLHPPDATHIATHPDQSIKKASQTAGYSGAAH